MKKPELKELKEKLPYYKSIKDIIDSHQDWSYKRAATLIKENKLDISHFDCNGSYKRIKYPKIIKICPQCKIEFETKKGHKKEKIYCSQRCCALLREVPSRVKHLQKNNLSKRKDSPTHYRPICFKNFDKKCQLCFFEDYVVVHHIDGNRNNDKEENLIPLCPNHHTMIHIKKYYKDTQVQIDKVMLKIFGKKYSKITPHQIFCLGNSKSYTSKCPEKKELAKLVWKIPSTQLAKKYGVSDSSIVKWCKKLGINKPSRGYWQKQGKRKIYDNFKERIS